MTRYDVLQLLNQGIVEIEFKKANSDTIRTMAATLDWSLIPQPEDTEAEKTPRKENPDVQRVYDVEVEGWRSFRWNNLMLVGGIEYVDSKE